MGYAIYSDFLRGNQGDYIGSFTSFMGVQNSICWVYECHFGIEIFEVGSYRYV